MNTTVWEKAPINHIERQCPATGYPVVKSKQEAGKICITTLTDAKKADPLQNMLRWRNFNSLLEMTWPNKEAYAKKHGYYLFDESDSLDTSRPPSWSKIKAAQRLLTKENCDCYGQHQQAGVAAAAAAAVGDEEQEEYDYDQDQEQYQYQLMIMMMMI